MNEGERTDSTHSERYPLGDIWKDIPGTFTFPDFYTWLAEQFPTGHIVEIGCDHGQSAAYLASRLDDSARLDLVDIGLDRLSPALNSFANIGERHNMTSVVAASLYVDGSLDCAFIDADHEYGPVKQDIRAWWPKVKVGGVLAGHDFSPEHFPGLVQAVADCFRSDVVNTMRGARWQVCKRGCFGSAWHGHFVHEEEDGMYLPVWWVRKVA